MNTLKKHLLTLIVFLPFCGPTAQNPYAINWSAAQESDQDVVSSGVVYADTGGVLIYRQEIEEYYSISDNIYKSSAKKLPPILEHYDIKLRRDYSFSLEGWSPLHKDRSIKDGFTEGQEDRWYFPFHSKGKSWFVYSNYVRSDKTIVVKTQELDLAKRGLTGEPIELFRVKDTIQWRLGPEKMGDNLSVNILRDQAESKIMFFVFPQPPFTNHFNIKVFDRKMRPLWSKEYHLPFEESTFEVRRFLLSVTGKLYCLARVYEPLPDDDRNGRQSRAYVPMNVTLSSKAEYAPYSTILLELSGESENANMYRLDLDKSLLVDAWLMEDRDGQVHCAGFYSNEGYNRYSGCVDFVLNPMTQTMTPRGPLPFSPNFLQKISLKKGVEKESFIESCNLTDLRLLPDNGLVMSGEYSDRKGAYHVLSMNIDADFKTMEGVRLKKSQLVKWQSDWLFVGYLGQNQADGQSLFLFNEDIQDKNNINLFAWSGNGDATSYVMPQPDDKKHLQIVTNQSFSTPDKKLYFLAETRNHKTFRVGVLQRKQ
jgi:hypothetical protein